MKNIKTHILEFREIAIIVLKNYEILSGIENISKVTVKT